MGSKLKEDEKNEKAIRALLRKAPNRRCINCNSLGPQYACLNFWTFVCTQCSGIHREFTHRVKSVSMSKFSSQEVASLETGGNERGKEIHFKDWDPQRQPLPDSSNVDRLREFIKMVYVEKRFSGERPLPRTRGGDREETYDNRRPDPRPSYRSDSRSPPYEDRFDDRGRRSNASYDDRRPDDRGTRFDEKRSPARFENDRSRYDRNYNDGRHYDERPRYENRDRYQYEDRYDGPERRFEDRFANERGSRGYGNSSPPPPIRPVKEILGEDVPPLRVETHGNHTNGGGGRGIDKSQGTQSDGRGQHFGSSSSFGSVDGNVPAVAPVVKREDSTSLIDFSVEPEPPVAKGQADSFGMTAAAQPVVDSLNSTGWATFEPAAPAPSLEAVAQAPVVGVTQAPLVAGVTDILGGFTNNTTVANGNSQWASQWAALPAQSADAGANSWATLAGPPPTSSQPWNAFSATPGEASFVPSSHVARPLDPLMAGPSGAATQVTQAQPSGRTEIPEDFFGGSFSSNQFTGGQPFGAQYAPPMGGVNLMRPGSYTQPQKSSNPFDLPGDTGSGQAAGEFPSLAPLQAALPPLSMGPRLAAGPGIGAYASQWSHTNVMAPSQSLYSSTHMSTGPPQAGTGFLVAQPPQPFLPQALQGGSLGPSLGLNVSGSYVTASSSKSAGPESLYPAQNFQSQNTFGGADSMFSTQGASPFSYQNSAVGPVHFGGTDSFMVGPPGQQHRSTQGSLGPLGSLQGVDSLFPSQQPTVQQRLLSQGSLGSLSNMPSADSLFPSQQAFPGQRLMSHKSLGNLSSMNTMDTQFSMQPPSQFSANSVGNPFG